MLINQKIMEVKQVDQKPPSLKVEVLTKMIDLATAGFGLVAALAWNDAIKAIFDAVFPTAGNIAAKVIYAAVITVIVVFITLRLGKLLNLAKKI
ncbi:MAG: DUF5654 family protein [Candidatus Methylomirabilota bacterium]